jgi:alpha-galactosidase
MLDTSWNITFSYHLGNERYDLEPLTTGTRFAEGVRLVVEERQLPLGKRLLFFAEPAPGGDGLFAVPGKVCFELKAEGLSGVFLNGYQSWTESRERDSGDVPVRFRSIFSPWIRHYLLERYGDAFFSGSSFRDGGYHGYSFAYLKQDGITTLCAGLSEDEAFSRIEWIPGGGGGGTLRFLPELPGGSIGGVRKLMDLLLLEGGEEEVFDLWSREAGGFGPVVPPPPASGWTSWYDYYEKVTEEDVLQVLSSYRRIGIPADVIQIDDGWQQSVGDWLDVKPVFPRGMAALAEDISNAGYLPGLWIAPFIAESSSRLAAEHPDWFLKGEDGSPLAAGYNPFNWSGYSWALDIYNHHVRNYLRTVFSTVVGRWGYGLLKLDFLYAAALAPPAGKTRGRVMRDAMEFLREIAGGAQILGCGVPLLSAAGLVEYCRIGSDVALKWEDARLRAAGYPERVSTINSLRSTIGRRMTDGRLFRNDPDVSMLRDWNCRMSEGEKETLFLCNNIFGSLLFTSDDPGRYSESELGLFLSAYPVRNKEHMEVDREGERFTVRFRIGMLRYMAFINLERGHHHFHLPEGLYYAYRDGFRNGGDLELGGRHSVCFLCVDEAGFSIAGSTGQLFPGSEVEAFSVAGDEVHLALDPKALCGGLLFIRIPLTARECRVNGLVVDIEEKAGFRLAVLEKALAAC